MDALSRTDLVDMLIEAYVDWRAACTRVAETYRAGASTTGPGGRTAFEIYLTALDAEEQAAAVYARAVRRANELLWGAAPARTSREPTWRVSSA